LIQTVAYFLGGIGVFFAGMTMLSSSLRGLLSDKFRVLLARWAGVRIKTAGISIFAGAVSQSIPVLSQILSSHVSVGTIDVREALIVTFWAHIGACLIVLLALVDLNTGIVILMGVAGLVYSFDSNQKRRTGSLAIFGLALLFLGLAMVKNGCDDLLRIHCVADIATMGLESYIAAFFIGALTAALCNSFPAATILGITLACNGVCTPEQAVIFIYGAALGGMASTLFAAQKFQGTSKQMVMANILITMSALFIFVPLFFVETYLDTPLVLSLVMRITHSLEFNLACVFLLFNLAPIIPLSLVSRQYVRALKRFWPPTPEEKWSQVMHLRYKTLDTPEIAIELVEQEQARLLRQLTHYFHYMRTSGVENIEDSLRTISEAFLSVSHEVRRFVGSLLEMKHGHGVTEQALSCLNRQNLLESLNDVLEDMTRVLSGMPPDSAGAQLKDVLVEGLELILLEACEASESQNPDNLDALLVMTDDKRAGMQRLRRNYLARDQGMDPKERVAALQVTGLYERAAWVLGQIALQHRHVLKKNVVKFSNLVESF
jgi:phosphate:Na+ symporter